jgi:hypothetical protein
MVPSERRQIPLVSLRELHRTVVVAVITVRMVQVPVHQVIGVIAVRDGFVAAPRSVLVLLVVGPARVLRRAIRRVPVVHLEAVLIHVPLMHVVQVAVVEVVRMPVVHHRGMAALRTVLVRVLPVRLMAHHLCSRCRS